MRRFVLGFVTGVAWVEKGPGSLWFAWRLYNFAIWREDRRKERRRRWL